MTQLSLPGVFLPTPPAAIKDPAVAQAFRTLQSALESELSKLPRDNVARTSFMMMAPNGSVYQLSIDNAGAFVAIKVFG